MVTRSVDVAGIMVWNCFAWALWAWAIVEVVRVPARDFGHGWGSKICRLLLIVCCSIGLGGLFLPFGAAVILAGLRRTRRRPEVPQLPPAAPRGPQLPGGSR
ncbi:MAG: hypothetical protein ACRDZ8_02560 [Acidimicrobiales bacterium]